MTRTIPRPTVWEIWELSIQLCLLPLVFTPRPMALAGCRLVATFLLRPGCKYRRSLKSQLPQPIAESFHGRPMAALRQSETMMLYQRMLVLRGAIFPWWKQRVAVAGLANVQAALAGGHGVILWVQPCLGSSVFVKQALFEAGLPLAHLTRPSHGFSPHSFGTRVMNPFMRRAENRFLAERVVITDDQTVGPLRRLQTLLHENRVVSITVTTAATRLSAFPFLGGTIFLPDGPVALAARTGATILPVFTIGSENPQTVEIGSPLPVGQTSLGAIQECQEASLRWLHARIDAHPVDWIAWRTDLYSRVDEESDE